jgi:putative tricarboxylic transport membrane protein
MSAATGKRVPDDVVAGVGLAAFGVVYTLIALQIEPDQSAASVIGPNVFPLAFGGFLSIGGLILAGMSLAKHGRDTRGEAIPGAAAAGTAASGPSAAAVAPHPADTAVANPRPHRLWVIFVLLIGYVALFIPLGYVLATAAFLLALMIYLSPHRIAVNVAFAVLFPSVVYALFTYGLGVNLPNGVLAGVLQ